MRFRRNGDLLIRLTEVCVEIAASALLVWGDNGLAYEPGGSVASLYSVTHPVRLQFFRKPWQSRRGRFRGTVPENPNLRPAWETGPRELNLSLGRPRPEMDERDEAAKRTRYTAEDL